MILWIKENIGSIIVALFLLVLVAVIVFKIIKDKRSGKCSCGNSCGGCAMKEMCHSKDK